MLQKYFNFFSKILGGVFLSMVGLSQVFALSVRVPENLENAVAALGVDGVFVYSDGTGEMERENRQGMQVIKCTLRGQVLTDNSRASVGDKEYVYYMLANITGLQCPAKVKGIIGVRGDSSLGLTSHLIGGEISVEEEGDQSFAISPMLKVDHPQLKEKLAKGRPKLYQRLEASQLEKKNRMLKEDVISTIQELRKSIYEKPEKATP
ncbi:MAG: hypothetical protein KDK66_01400 [Deltaproteobacteria bacterium]|nr:hypothetical protein [Deltaproteobacteria bacterium]